MIPQQNPHIRPQNAPGSVVLCQKMASKNVAATGGVRKLEMDWM